MVFTYVSKEPKVKSLFIINYLLEEGKIVIPSSRPTRKHSESTPSLLPDRVADLGTRNPPCSRTVLHKNSHKSRYRLNALVGFDRIGN